MPPLTVIAAVWVHRRGNAVLAVRPHGSDAFFLPGGMPERGETYPQAAAREVREETGMTVDPAGLRETVRVEDDAYGRPGVRVLLVCFEGPGTGEPAAGADEIAELAWLAPGQWHRFAPAVRRALAPPGAGPPGAGPPGAGPAGGGPGWGGPAGAGPAGGGPG